MKLNRACYFLDQNFAGDGEINQIIPSSEQFPLVAANLTDSYRRSKKWRSSGYFEFPGEKSLVIKEGAGPEVTITLPETSYSSRSDMLADLQASLNDHGSTTLTYTCSVNNVDKRTKIAATGVFSIISTNALSADLCHALGFTSAADYVGASEYISEARIIHSYEFLRIDLGVDGNPQALVLTGERNTKLNLSAAATVIIEANLTDNWAAPAFSQVVPFHDRTMVLFDENGLAPVPYRFWRIKIVDQDNPDGFIEFNKVYLGTMYSPIRGAATFPFSGSVDTRENQNTTEYGERFSTKRRKSDIFSVDWEHLTVTEKEYIMDIFERYGESKPLFMMFDGNGVFSSGPEFYTRMVYFTSPPYRLNNVKNFSLSTQFVEVP
ncbi:hypothetical protein [Bdellovibrio bacteriovorus]|uniref:hypothetical protein n=1 Tax=Bdellovibrio bacteriovorus TaxID=959 RepID=UPI0035A5FFC5